MQKTVTREQWLQKATELLREGVFRKSPTAIPKIHVSVGFPGGKSPAKVIGQHWHPKASKDGVSHVFVSPVNKNSLEVLETLAHECVHACVPDANHGPAFKRIALAIGFEGPMKTTPAGPDLKTALKLIIAELGEIPHSHLTLRDPTKKKQTTRMVKLCCPDCGYVARTSRQWIEMLGAVLCPCNGLPMQSEGGEEGEGDE